MKDYLLRGMTKDKSIRFFAVNAMETVQTAIDMHYLSITNSVVLGRLLISGLLLSASLKNSKDLLTLRVDGDGPIGSVLVTAKGDNTIKGYVQNPQVELPKTQKGFAISDAIGKGFLTVIKSIGDSPPYNSQVELVTSEIGEDICHYFQQSEQIDTMLNLGILIEPDARLKQAGGILVQCMPLQIFDEELQVTSYKLQENSPLHPPTHSSWGGQLERLNDNISKFPNLSDFMDMGHTLEHILENHIFKGIPIEIKQKSPVAYLCNCDRERFLNGIKLLGKAEIQNMIDENKPITAECHFCDKTYEFSIDELKNN